jgi:L-ascorbate metabolism protein UlaG (beta-lactamase superfamily)
MRLTYLAHASLLIEVGGVRLVTDPWLDGPSYLSAWWHFPEPACSGAALAGIDYVYLTHEHVDHFHEPTLRALDPKTPILIGRFLSPRFRDKLAALGFSDVRELPHGREVALSDQLKVASFQYRADDTALVITDGTTTLLDMNDCLLRAGSLAELLRRYPRIDLLCASFANAEAYPIVYDFEDAADRIDWDDRSRFDGFLERVRQIAPAAFVPFASMFCFLSDELFPLNARIVSPAPLLSRAQAGEVASRGLPMNPGDRWTPEGGHEVVSPVDWSRKDELLREYAARHRDELLALAAAEVVPGGQRALDAAFDEFFRRFACACAAPLRRRLDLRVRFDISGPAGSVRWVRLTRGHLELTAPAAKDDWDVRISIPDWPLYRAVTGADTWQSLGISCRFRVALKAGARPREILFWFALYLHDLGYTRPGAFASRRALSVLWRRRREWAEYAGDLLRGRFVDGSLRGKFEPR